MELLVTLNWSLKLYEQLPVQTDSIPLVVKMTFGALLAEFRNL